MRPEFLTRLAEADQNATPSAAVEARLRAAVRARKESSHRLAYTLLAAAAAVLVIAWAIRKPAAVKIPAAPVIAAVEQPARDVPAPAAALAQPSATAVQPGTRPVQEVAKLTPPVPARVRRAASRAVGRRPAAANRSEPEAVVEQVTEFFALTADAREIRPGSQLMRVRMPRAAMATFGFPLSAEMSRGQINADVLVGDDGIARAIRFVHGN